MNQKPLLTRRQIITYVVLSVMALGLIFAGWFLFNHGGLKVTTASKESTITVVPVNDENSITTTTNGNTLDTFIKKGNYIVTVKDGQKQTKTVVEVAPFKIKEVNLNPPEIRYSEAVTNISASSFTASTTSFSMLDSEAGELAFINKDNQYTHTDDTIDYESAVWAKTGDGYAVGRSINTNNRTFVEYKNGTVSEIATPSPITPSTYLAFDIGQDNALYIIQDGSFYRRDGEGKYSLIGKTDKESLILSVNSSYATFLYRSAEEVCQIQFMKLSDQKITKREVECVQDPAYIYGAEWSPNGKELALTTGKSLEILNADLSTKLTIPDYKAVNSLWAADNILIYTSKNNIWSYDTSTNTTSVIASTPEYIDVTLLQKSSDTDTYYFSGTADNTPTIYRTKPSGDSMSPVQKLSESNMQILSNVCHIRYVNFVKLELILKTAESTRDQCIQQVADYTQVIDTPNIPYQFDLREEFGYTDYIFEPTSE